MPSRSAAEQPVDRLELALHRLVAAARRLDRLVAAPLDELEVAEHELGLDELDVGLRVGGVAHVGHVRVRERADHVRDRVDPADVGEEAVAEALAAARAFGEAGDVDDVDRRVDLLRRLEHLVQAVEALVGHGTTPRFDSADVYAYAVAAALACVSALKSVVLPTLGRPTMPSFTPSLLRSRPRSPARW